MTIRESVADNLGLENLEDFIIKEYLSGKKEATQIVEDNFSKSEQRIQDLEKDDHKIIYILSEILLLKKMDSEISHSQYYILHSLFRQHAFNHNVNISKEENEIAHFASFILDFSDFNKTNIDRYIYLIATTKENSLYFYLQKNLRSKANLYFEILNAICVFESYKWSWDVFEEGIIKFHNGYIINLESKNIDRKYEIEKIKLKSESEADKLNNKIRVLSEELENVKGQIQYRDDYFEKYYYKSQIIIKDTYFGDNLPFLFNLFNFLKRNNLYDYGWSYFYECLTRENNEQISLSTTKKMNFVGRIFYHLTDYLILHYKDESFMFLKSKFLINEKPITDSFKINHMKTKFDVYDDSELVNVDDFFANQKKIYIK